MRLLVVSGFWPRKSNEVTGIFVVQQIRALVKQGCHVTVLIPTPILKPGASPLSPADLGLRGGIAILSVPYVSLPQRIFGPRLAFAVNWRCCARALYKAVGDLMSSADFDAVHIHDLRYGGLSVPAWRPLLSNQAQFVIILHGVDPFLQASEKTPLVRHALDQVWAIADRVVLVGRPLADYARALGVTADQIEIIGNGTEIPMEVARGAMQRPLTQRRVILSVSNLDNLKGIDFNLKALARIATRRPDIDWEYRVIGEGAERVRLENMAVSLGIHHRVNFLGRLPYADTTSQMAECDIFSLPSWGEAFGIVYLEAMARYRPVIGCAGMGANEIVRDGVDGFLVRPRDEHTLVEAIERLLVYPELASCMGRAARERAKNFTWDANARRYIELQDGKRPTMRACNSN